MSCRRGITEQPSAGSTPGLQGPLCSWTNLPVPLSGYLGLSLPGKGHDDSMHAASTSSFRCHPNPKSARTSVYPGLVAAWLCLPRVRLQSAALMQRDGSLPQKEDGSLCLCSSPFPELWCRAADSPNPAGDLWGELQLHVTVFPSSLLLTTFCYIQPPACFHTAHVASPFLLLNIKS